MSWFTSKRSAIVIVDIVESVRLIQSYEQDSIRRWLNIVQYSESQVLPQRSGRLVKSLGDGMLLEFASVSDAVLAAQEIQRFSQAENAQVPPEQQLHLRAGVNTGEVLTDAHDIYGHAVNIAARLMGLAGPGETVISASAREELSMAAFPNVEDMGDCFVKHVDAPIRAFRLGGASPILMPAVDSQTLLPTLAVVPLQSLQQSTDIAFGHILAEELIRSLGRLSGVRVISRLSTAAYQNYAPAIGDIGRDLGASHVLSGRVVESGGPLSLTLDLTETRSGEMIWTENFNVDPASILGADDSVQARIAETVAKVILKRELKRARTLPVRSLESYSLLLGAIHMMYRLSRSDFEQARHMLEAVIDRNPRQSLPHAWMGNWHVLNVQQGWNKERADQYRLATDQTNRALDLDPDCELSLTFDGFVRTNLGDDFDTALQRYDAALDQNPNTSLAWLLKGTLQSFQGDDAAAIENGVKGQSLSPLDPHTYFYDCLIGGCYASAGQYDKAYPHLLRSLRQNAHHTSTLRVMTVVEWQLGKHDGARRTMEKMMKLQPGMTVAAWMKDYGSIRFAQVAPEIFRKAGMPAG